MINRCKKRGSHRLTGTCELVLILIDVSGFHFQTRVLKLNWSSYNDHIDFKMKVIGSNFNYLFLLYICCCLKQQNKNQWIANVKKTIQQQKAVHSGTALLSSLKSKWKENQIHIPLSVLKEFWGGMNSKHVHNHTHMYREIYKLQYPDIMKLC